MIKLEINLKLINENFVFKKNNIDVSVYETMLQDILNTEIEFNLFGEKRFIKPTIDRKKYIVNFAIELHGEYNKKEKEYVEGNLEEFRKDPLTLELKMERWDFFEDADEIENIKKIMSLFCLALLISYPKVDFCSIPCSIKIDKVNIFKEFIIASPPTLDCIEKYIKIDNKFVEIHVDETLKWLYKNTNYLSNSYDNIDILFNSLSNVVSKDGFEAIIYAIVGLENIYAKNRNNKLIQLTENICSIYDFIKPKDIKQIYDVRSKFVHGDYPFPNHYTYYLSYPNSVTEDYQKTLNISYALIILTLQKFIVTDTNYIDFQKSIKPVFERK